ncbi:MAG: hypothetical protein ACK58H_00845 [Planctomyces sp.]
MSASTVPPVIRLVLGCLLWTLPVAWGLYATASQSAGATSVVQLFRQMGRWAGGATVQMQANSDVPVMLAANDPVFYTDATGRTLQVGKVRTAGGLLFDPAPARQTVLLFDEAMIRQACPEGFELHYYSTPTSLDWVARTLLPQERRAEITSILAREWQKHGPELTARMQPILQDAVGQMALAVESHLPTVLEQHRTQISKIADRYQEEVVKQKVVPLVRAQILPIIEREIRPVALDVGRELWDRVSLWSFTWRYLYDVSPLPERNAVKREFERFLAEEIRPAMEARVDDFVAATERIVRAVSQNREVREVIRESLHSSATDTQIRDLTWSVFRDAFLTNPAVHQALQASLSSADAQQALRLAGSSFEPAVREIGDAIFGNRDDGIRAEFARVMRLQILLKDRRWLQVVPRSQGAEKSSKIVIRIGTDSKQFPLEFEGRQLSPLTMPEPVLQP